MWKLNSRPEIGYIAEMRRLSRAKYNRGVRHLKRPENRMRTKKMADTLISKRARNLWPEVKRMKVPSSKSAGSIDVVYADKDIDDVFSDQYTVKLCSI